jgi:predicted acylesterase/phospholipase RssA
MKTVALALQGGGAHGAFVWGVLDRLCQERHLKISAISGASSGAFNAAVYLYGLASGGAKGAREALEDFWTNVAKQALWSGNPFIGASFLAHFAISTTTRWRFGLSNSRRSYRRTICPFSPIPSNLWRGPL